MAHNSMISEVYTARIGPSLSTLQSHLRWMVVGALYSVQNAAVSEPLDAVAFHENYTFFRAYEA